MKKIIITLIISTLTATNAFTQNYVTESKKYIETQLKKKRIDFEEKKSNDGFDYFVFHDESMQVEYFFDKNNICCLYRIFYPYHVHKEVQAKLDVEFEYLGKMMWREYGANNIFIWMILFYGEEQCIVSVTTEDRLTETN